MDSQFDRTRAADVFHAHLDACWQCREHPFSLCRTGQRLIEESLREADAAIARAFEGMPRG